MGSIPIAGTHVDAAARLLYGSVVGYAVVHWLVNLYEERRDVFDRVRQGDHSMYAAPYGAYRWWVAEAGRPYVEIPTRVIEDFAMSIEELAHADSHAP